MGDIEDIIKETLKNADKIAQQVLLEESKKKPVNQKEYIGDINFSSYLFGGVTVCALIYSVYMGWKQYNTQKYKSIPIDDNTDSIALSGITIGGKKKHSFEI